VCFVFVSLVLRVCDFVFSIFGFLFFVILFCFDFVVFWKCVQAEVCLRARRHGLEPPRNLCVEEAPNVGFLVVVRATGRHVGSLGSLVSIGWGQSVRKLSVIRYGKKLDYNAQCIFWILVLWSRHGMTYNNI